MPHHNYGDINQQGWGKVLEIGIGDANERKPGVQIC